MYGRNFNLAGGWVVVLAMAMSCAGVAQAQSTRPRAQELAFTTRVLPNGTAGRSYRFAIQAEGGTAPYRFRVVDVKKLPPGLVFDASSRLLSGTPRQGGTYSFYVEVVDARGEPLLREFTLRIFGVLEVQWKQFPAVQQDQILGSVEVSNYGDDTFDLTVIIVAVNEVGKAFALGYERIELGANTQRREVSFGARNNLPYGKYVVHVDAVAEVAARNSIYRARLQTPAPLDVASP